MGLQVFTDNKIPKQFLKLIADNDQQIIEYVDHLKKGGYEILEFPPIQRNVAKQSWINLNVLVPVVSEKNN
jgi:uroporphyrinogen-III synthase